MKGEAIRKASFLLLCSHKMEKQKIYYLFHGVICAFVTGSCTRVQHLRVKVTNPFRIVVYLNNFNSIVRKFIFHGIQKLKNIVYGSVRIIEWLFFYSNINTLIYIYMVICCGSNVVGI